MEIIILIFILKFQRPQDLFSVQMGCYNGQKGCYNVKTNISLTVKKCLLYHENCGKFFTRSDMIFIIPLAVTKIFVVY